MSFMNLSYRYKVPLWGSFLIVVSALAVSASFMLNAYNKLENDLAIESEQLGYSLKSNLFSAMLQDDVWRAFEIIAEASQRPASARVHVESMVVVDNALRVVVSTHPKETPMLTTMGELGAEFRELATRISVMSGEQAKTVYLRHSKHYYSLTPISKDNTRLGTLVIVHSRDVFLPLYADSAWDALSVGGLILAILLPFNWYWGQRMALPLVQLAARMEQLGKKWPEKLDPALYEYHDELGSLFEAYHHLLKDLKAKETLEARMVQSERLAALGQLAAGIAHEINNPLSGMLTAIDTLKYHTDTSPLTQKTIALIERGLNQVKETVAALLVESKVKSRTLTPQDIEDVLMLISPMSSRKALHIAWHNSISEEIGLPATCIRQILINLLMNAIKAAAHQGEVACDIGIEAAQLRISVSNNGKMLTEEQIAHLFEPFAAFSEGGHGLGLWVTYQVVQQLGGNITVSREMKDRMNFRVTIPIENET
ncbi:MAG: HAMP domain-containing sensor histidine kinase [Gallionella sp.]|nr:HAMP domain-containing sensor histidine kinase [Gallionella sp.]MDD4945600.1 HAMP domain-containing sensor histidine kinase [Gallionella sp.]MDD5612051.1 HAMP domain-containing sensor histidine kinase [Gallionella sp.]